MKLKTVYLVLCVLGVLLPYWQFIPWVMRHGLNMPLFFRELFANRVSAFFGIDLVLSAIVLLVFMAAESRRIGWNKIWPPLPALFLVGVSLAFPLFLYIREAKMENREKVAAGH